MEIKEWEKITENKYLEFGRIPDPEKLNIIPDICALIYAQKRGLLIGDNDALHGAWHDTVCTRIATEKLTTEDAIYLARCGLSYDGEIDCLVFFV